MTAYPITGRDFWYLSLLRFANMSTNYVWLDSWMGCRLIYFVHFFEFKTYTEVYCTGLAPMDTWFSQWCWAGKAFDLLRTNSSRKRLNDGDLPFSDRALPGPVVRFIVCRLLSMEHVRERIFGSDANHGLASATYGATGVVVLPLRIVKMMKWMTETLLVVPVDSYVDVRRRPCLELDGNTELPRSTNAAVPEHGNIVFSLL